MRVAALFLFAIPLGGIASSNELPGNWALDCTPLPKRHSVTGQLKLDSSSLTAHFNQFADHECQTINLNIDLQYQYTTGASFGEGTALDLMPISATMTLLNEEVVQYYNRNSICGFNDWIMNRAHDVSGATCPGFSAPARDQSIYDIFGIDGGQLRFGRFPGLGPVHEDARPRSLQSALMFHPAESGFRLVRSKHSSQ
jgi:hypothetical protein